MSTNIEQMKSEVKQPTVEAINPWRESVLFVLIGTSTVTVGTVFSIISLLLPILAIPWFITSIPTGLNNPEGLIEYIQVFTGDVSGAIIASLILGIFAHGFYILNKLIFHTIRVFDNKFRWMDPVSIITRIKDWQKIIKIVLIVGIVFGLTFVAITMSGAGLSWQEWGQRGNK